MISKKELRKEILQKRDGLTIEARVEKSRQITENLIKHTAFQKAEKVLLFASFKSEVNTSQIIEEALRLGKAAYLPKVMGDEMEFYQIDDCSNLEEGYFGIREPEINVEKKFIPHQKDKLFILMPGAVFDETGNRIGYGGGYYDKFLLQLERKISKENLCKMAVAFECQMVETGKIMKENHDIKPDFIMTEERMIAIV